jgi:hypothetical protein
MFLADLGVGRGVDGLATQGPGHHGEDQRRQQDRQPVPPGMGGMSVSSHFETDTLVAI